MISAYIQAQDRLTKATAVLEQRDRKFQEMMLDWLRRFDPSESEKN